MFYVVCFLVPSALAMKTDFSRSIPTNDAAKQGMERILSRNVVDDLQEDKSLPDPENDTKQEEGMEGMGDLGRNLEFMMMKIAQLETVVELQQLQIKDMNEWRKAHMSREHNAPQPQPPSTQEVQLAAKTKIRQAHDTLKGVLRKHHKQLETRTFATKAHETQQPQAVPSNSAEARAPGGAGQALLQRSEEGGEEERSLDATVSSKFIGTLTSGTGLIGDALGDAYERATDPVAFVAETVVDTVEMAVDILSRGFTDFKAGCSPRSAPGVKVDELGFSVSFGRQKCWFRLMGQQLTLFDFNFGRKSVNWPAPIKMAITIGKGLANCRGGFGDVMKCIGSEMANNIPPLKAVLTMGDELSKCAKRSNAGDVIKCLGMRIVQTVPPLSFLNKMSDMLTEYLQGFARTAATVAGQALKDGVALIQDASVSTFPQAGTAPVVKHESRNFMIQTHSQRAQGGFSRERTSTEGDDDPPTDGLGFKVGVEGSNYASKLITQFGGRETDTSSCLAFAPQSRRSRKTRSDWQVSKKDDFIKLEPYAVPCGVSWMKSNPTKWEGYAFYTSELAIEKCLTVTYKMNAQPVLAFVGGLQFDVMPGPLASVDAQVCWPLGNPDGMDLTQLKTVIRSCGVTLFSRTLRLSKRFGSSTDFEGKNTYGSTATWIRPANPRESMSRTKLLETNSSIHPEDLPSMNSSEAQLEWEAPMEDLYLASMDLGPDLGMKTHSELRGEAVARRLKGEQSGERMAEEELLGLSSSGSSSLFQLFSFKHPGNINFQLKGLLEGNSLELGMRMGFGPFESEEKRLKLVDIVDQFAVTLNALPFVSSKSKEKALDALRSFSTNYVPPTIFEPGTMVALYSKRHERYIKASNRRRGRDLGATGKMKARDLKKTWDREYFTVVDAGNGEVAFHNPRFNRFIRMASKTNMDMSGDRATLPAGWKSERFTPVNAGNGQIALYCRAHRRFVQMRPDGSMKTKGGGNGDKDLNVDDLSPTWTYERFTVVQGHPYFYLEPGSVVAFRCNKHHRFMRMNGGDMSRSDIHGAYKPSSRRSYTYFKVVDAGGGLIALHSAKYNRFVAMLSNGKMRASATKSAHELPDDWMSLRFAVVPAGNEQIALHNPWRGRFISMSNSDMVVSGSKKAQDLPGHWSWERFKVYVVSSPSRASSHTGAFEGAR